MILSILFFITLLQSSNALDYNINLRFDEETEAKIIQFTKEITKQYNFTNEIDFVKCAPHITLYLTTFDIDKTEDIIKLLSKALRSLRGCTIEMKELYASGDYFMWRSYNSRCLQRLSNRVVEFTSKYRSENYTIPEWVYGLEDEAERKKKIFYCEHFGSPNVFDGFDPHFTLIVANSTQVNFKQIIDDINNGKVNITIPTFNNLQ